MNKLPISRIENIIVQNLDKEVLIYDLNTDKAYCLNATAAIVYQSCDGQTSFDRLKAEYPKLTDELILLAIEELQKQNLLQGRFENGILRRSLLSKAAFATLALPMITSLVAPRAAHAASCLGRNSSCTSSAQCCPEFCQFEPSTNFIGCLNGTCRPIQGCPV